MATFVRRVIGAALLDAATYEEVEADPKAITQAVAVVVLSSIAAGIGTANSEAGTMGTVWIAVATLIGWFAWAVVTWLVGTLMLPEPQTQSNLGELLRTIGFSASPGILRIAALVPGVGWLIAFAAWLWMLAAMVVAVRQALDYKGTGRAILVCVIGFFVQVGVVFAITLAMGVSALAMGKLPGM
jgi:hypothetical protein